MINKSVITVISALQDSILTVQDNILGLLKVVEELDGRVSEIEESFKKDDELLAKSVMTHDAED